MKLNAKRKNAIDGAALGIWQCCGEYLAPAANCPKCGKSKDHADSTGLAVAKSERTDRNALRQAIKATQGIFPATARLRIVITRGYQGIPLDHDNLVGGCKPFRDEIARLLGRDDAEHRGTNWEYRQEKGRVRKVEIFKEEE